MSFNRTLYNSLIHPKSDLVNHMLSPKNPPSFINVALGKRHTFFYMCDRNIPCEINTSKTSHDPFWHHNEKYVASHKKILRKQTISHELNLWSLQSINYCINIILVTSFYCTLPYFFLLSLKLTPYFWFFSLKKVKTTQDKYILHVRLYINNKT